MLYLCLSTGADHRGLPLFVGLFGLFSDKKCLILAKKQVREE